MSGCCVKPLVIKVAARVSFGPLARLTIRYVWAAAVPHGPPPVGWQGPPPVLLGPGASGGHDECFSKRARPTENDLSQHPHRGVRSPSPVPGSHRVRP
jgi:hypothetical protein